MKRYCFFLTMTIIIAFMSYSQPARSAAIYVSPSGAGVGSLADPTDLQSALDTAKTNNEDDTIYLMEGTYDASTAGADTFEYDSTGNDEKKVTLSGSWNNAYTNQKKTDAPSTILDGNGTSRVLSLYAVSVSFDFAIEYLEIKNGYLAASTGNGAGLRALSVNAGNINLKVHHVGFITNTTSIGVGGGAGGGMSINSYFEATDCYFKDNLANNAGGMYFYSTDQSLSPKIDNCVFEGNMSGSAASIGNISTILFSNSPVITNSEFKGNPTWLYSASAVNSGGGTNTLTVHNCTFSDFNTSHWGGAIHIWNYNATITNSLFVNNSAGNNGDGKGGAIAIFDPNNSGKQVTISNCTFYGNMANQGGSPGGAIANRVESLIITNSIFWNNDNYDIYNYFHSPPGYAPAIISYSNIEGGLTSTKFTDGGNNINTDPLFVNVTGAPSTWDFHLQETSPCIDTGDSVSAPSDDLEKNRRPQDGDKDGIKTADMGCYEYPGMFPWTMFFPGIISRAK